jgi:hypothetical protein
MTDLNSINAQIRSRQENVDGAKVSAMVSLRMFPCPLALMRFAA